MIIIYDFNLSLEEYAERGKRNDFPIVEQCPHCRGRVRLWRHGFFWRYALEERKEYRIPICRLKCPSCKKTVSLLPDFLLPYFQHTLSTVLKRLKAGLLGKITGCYQLVQFYRKRFLKQLNQVEMFFRAEGFRGTLPQDRITKAIKLLEMILVFGEATFARRSSGHFTRNFMAL